MKIKDMPIEQLYTIYSITCEICKEYSRMTDGYILATGDNLLDSETNIPDDISKAIKERQQFFSIKNKITKELKEKLLKEIEYAD